MHKDISGRNFLPWVWHLYSGLFTAIRGLTYALTLKTKPTDSSNPEQLRQRLWLIGCPDHLSPEKRKKSSFSVASIERLHGDSSFHVRTAWWCRGPAERWADRGPIMDESLPEWSMTLQNWPQISRRYGPQRWISALSFHLSFIAWQR